MPKRKLAADDAVSFLVEDKQHQAAHQVGMKGTGMVAAPAVQSFAPNTRAINNLGMWHHMMGQL